MKHNVNRFRGIALASAFLLLATLLMGQAPTPASAQGGRTPISIYTNPHGAVVYLDRQRLGFSPVRSWVVLPGWHEIRAHRGGFYDSAIRVHVRPGAGRRYVLNLRPIPRH